MINLDSEEDDGIYIGCAGGRDTVFTLSGRRTKLSNHSAVRKISVGGLLGGHSGMDINRNRGNAIKILARVLFEASETMPVRVLSIDGGTKRNAIARDAHAVIAIPAEQSRAFRSQILQATDAMREAEIALEDRGFEVSVKPARGDRSFGLESSRQILNLLSSIPHGVVAMSQTIDELVETSTNLGVISTDGNRIRITCCSRSSVGSSIHGLAIQHRALSQMAGAELDQPEGYPGWQPDPDSALVGITQVVYKETLGQDPKLKAIHGGLECGLFTEKYPELDIVSFGPNILGAHSPDERVSISSVGRIWKLLGTLLERLS
jgi:dipeptidase D